LIPLYHRPVKGIQLSQKDELKAKLRSIAKRHKHNRRIGEFWLLFVVVLGFAYFAADMVAPSLGGEIEGVAFVTFLIGSVLAGRSLRTIQTEELALEHVVSAISGLEEFASDQDDELLDKSVKELRQAASGLTTFGSGSAIYSEGYETYRNLKKVLRTKIPYLVMKKNGQVDAAKQHLERVRSILLNPNLSLMKQFIAETAALPDEPPAPTRKTDWGQLAQRRVVHIPVSIVMAILIPLLFLYILALVLHLDATAVIGGNPVTFLGIVVATFIGILSWLGQLGRRGSA